MYIKKTQIYLTIVGQYFDNSKLVSPKMTTIHKARLMEIVAVQGNNKLAIVSIVHSQNIKLIKTNLHLVQM